MHCPDGTPAKVLAVSHVKVLSVKTQSSKHGDFIKSKKRITYGASKTIVFPLQIIVKASRGRVVKHTLLVLQVSFVVLFVLIVPLALHKVSRPRNSPLSFLRGERFYLYTVVTLLGLPTVQGLTPWWVFEPCKTEQVRKDTTIEGGLNIQKRNTVYSSSHVILSPSLRSVAKFST